LGDQGQGDDGNPTQHGEVEEGRGDLFKDAGDTLSSHVSNPLFDADARPFGFSHPRTAMAVLVWRFPRPLLFIDQITYRLTTLTFRNAAWLSIRPKSR
jgi:hypothetical protein